MKLFFEAKDGKYKDVKASMDPALVEKYRNLGAQWPLDNKVAVTSSSFGMRVHPVYKTRKWHHGVDIAESEGKSVKAIL
ncbi:MAG: hypothetical protein RL023_259 [Candidatus Parcubacteria bacterium]